MSLNLRAQRSASSLLVMMSVVGCKLTSPLDEVDTQLHPAPNGNGGTANTGGTNSTGGTNNTGGTANNGGNNPGGCDEIELLVDGSFDDGSGAWIEMSSNGFPLVQDAASLGAVAPDSGSFAAWLGGAEFEDSSLAQQVFIPEGTVSITASGVYGVTSTDPGLDDFSTISIGSDESGIAIGLQSWDPRNVVDPWAPFSSMTDAAELAGLELFFLIRSTTDGAENTNFFFDSLSVKATVCE